MNSTVKTAAALAAPSLISRIKLRYIVLGVAAYYGMKMLRSRGALPKQGEKALDFIDQGIDMAKEKIGFGATSVGSAASSLASSALAAVKGKADPSSIHAEASRAGSSSAPGIH